MTDEQGAAPTGAAPAPEEPRSPAQTPAEAVYDEVILSYFASAEKGEM